MLQLINVAEEAFDLVPSFVDIIVQLGIDLVTSVNLGLKIFDGTIDVAKRALLGVVLVLLLFEMGFKLESNCQTNGFSLFEWRCIRFAYLLDALVQEPHILTSR